MKYRPGDKAARTCQAKNDIEIPGIAIDRKRAHPNGEKCQIKKIREYILWAPLAPLNHREAQELRGFVSAGASDDTFPDAMWPVCSAV